MNPSEDAVAGKLTLLRDTGETVDEVDLAIPPRGTIVWQPHASGLHDETLFAVFSAKAAGAALVSFEKDGTLVSQHLVPGTAERQA